MPCVILSAALVGLYAIRLVKGGKEGREETSAEERVERLQRE